MLVPAGILAVILTCALIPDMAMQPVTEENPDEETAKVISMHAPGAVAVVPDARRIDPFTFNPEKSS